MRFEEWSVIWADPSLSTVSAERMMKSFLTANNPVEWIQLQITLNTGGRRWQLGRDVTQSQGGRESSWCGAWEGFWRQD